MVGNSHEVVKSEEVNDRKVKNQADEDLGTIIEIMIDKVSGQVAYVVLESGSFLGIGGKLFAIPWKSLNYDPSQECFILNIDKDRLKNAPGFDKDHWPNMADRQWGQSISQYYGSKNYWE